MSAVLLKHGNVAVVLSAVELQLAQVSTISILPALICSFDCYY
jgi:hypothetical protein